MKLHKWLLLQASFKASYSNVPKNAWSTLVHGTQKTKFIDESTGICSLFEGFMIQTNV